ncbi:MAG: ATP-dependent helicase HrpB [Firmicutes bacterium]|nr:ATP-dependent helicase HrpB [Bacillota bacterium]
MIKLPIEAILPELKQTIAASSNVVLVAQPGAGKTTRVPLALMEEPWLGGRKIIMLEPRRLAARTVARYMAAVLGEQVGRTVGYRVHRDTCATPQTRIEVVTEGILTRMLQNDPALENVGLVIFDEFHERSLQADLGLALALECQAVLREDIKIMVMSATLETENVASLLGNAPVIRSEGKNFPVDTYHLIRPAQEKLEAAVAAKVQEALRHQEGDILVFLPGTGEIKRVERLLRERLAADKIKIRPLYGELSQEQQDAALLPANPGQRKIVLATSIAQTSLTVEGVQVVIDSGLMRVSRFSPRTGMSRLETVKVSRHSADQRRGRAGRLGPGSCYRLWTNLEDAGLALRNTPEILAADLSALCLELAAWGVADPQELKWIDVPPKAACSQAVELLQQLGALDSEGKITAHGRKMNKTGLHPRLAHMLLTAVPMGMGAEACCLAALLSERDVLRSADGAEDVDLRLRLEVLQFWREAYAKRYPGYTVDQSRMKRLRQEVAYWQKTFAVSGNKDFDIHQCGILLALAYPDRIAQNKGKGRFLLRNGRRAVLKEQQTLAAEPFLVAADLSDAGVDSRIFLAAPVQEKELRQYMAEQIEDTQMISWDEKLKAVRAVKYQRLGALTLKEELVIPEDKELLLTVLLQGIRIEGLGILPWTNSTRQLKARMQFIHRIEASWPDVSESSLLDTLEVWLAPYLYDVKNAQQLTKLRLSEIIEAMLTWEQRQILNEWAPTHWKVPSGRSIAIDYTDPEAPVLAVKLQEMFGAVDTPVIAGGRVPLTIHLLSPASRPIQVTKDLASFWSAGYFAVKKDLKGKYPKHYWPEDPFKAMPTSRVRPREG